MDTSSATRLVSNDATWPSRLAVSSKKNDGDATGLCAPDFTLAARAAGAVVAPSSGENPYTRALTSFKTIAARRDATTASAPLAVQTPATTAPVVKADDPVVVAPPTDGSTTPPTDDVMPPTDDVTPPTDEIAPPTDETAPPTDETAPPTDETAPPTDETAPPTDEIAPPSDDIAPPDDDVTPPSDDPVGPEPV